MMSNVLLVLFMVLFQIENRAREVMFSASSVKGDSQLKQGVPLRSTTQHRGAADHARHKSPTKEARQAVGCNI